jgi:hypothetical protein
MSDSNSWSFGWAAIEALATVALTVGIVYAALQLRFDRNNAAIEKTIEMVREWNDEKIQGKLRYIDRTRYPGDLEKNRKFVNAIYLRWKRDKHFLTEMNRFLGEVTRLTERMYILLRSGLIDGDILTRHVGYEILEAYYAMQDVLADEAKRGYDFLSFFYLTVLLKPYYIAMPDEGKVRALEYVDYKKPVRSLE